jgi:hypothetical protein
MVAAPPLSWGVCFTTSFGAAVNVLWQSFIFSIFAFARDLHVVNQLRTETDFSQSTGAKNQLALGNVGCNRCRRTGRCYPCFATCRRHQAYSASYTSNWRLKFSVSSGKRRPYPVAMASNPGPISSVCRSASMSAACTILASRSKAGGWGEVDNWQKAPVAHISTAATTTTAAPRPDGVAPGGAQSHERSSRPVTLSLERTIACPVTLSFDLTRRARPEGAYR